MVLGSLALGCRGQPTGSAAVPSSTSVPREAAVPAEAEGPSPRELQARLREGKVFVQAEGDEFDLLVPPEARQALRDFKDALIDVLDRAMPGIVLEADPAAALQSAFEREGVAWANDERWKNGSVDGSAAAVPGHHERWSALVCILLAPGADCMLAIYEQRGGELRRSLVVRSDMYASVQGALQAMSWKLSPPDAEDRFYLLEAHTYPCPSSRWREFWYRALPPASVVFDAMSEQPPNFVVRTRHEWKRDHDRFRPVTPGVRERTSP